MTALLTDILPINPKPDTGWVRADVIASFAAAISIFSIFFTLVSIYLNKQLEIKFLKFDKLVLSTLDQLFVPIDQNFTQNPGNTVAGILPVVTESLVDIELFLVHFKDYYSTLELDVIIKYKEEFSDYLYANPALLVKDAKIAYLAFRTRVFFELYDFARRNDIGHLNRVKIKVKNFCKNHPFWLVVICLLIIIGFVLYLTR